jgi:hypothetical protein
MGLSNGRKGACPAFIVHCVVAIAERYAAFKEVGVEEADTPVLAWKGQLDIHLSPFLGLNLVLHKATFAVSPEGACWMPSALATAVPSESL